MQINQTNDSKLIETEFYSEVWFGADSPLGFIKVYSHIKVNKFNIYSKRASIDKFNITNFKLNQISIL